MLRLRLCNALSTLSATTDQRPGTTPALTTASEQRQVLILLRYLSVSWPGVCARTTSLQCSVDSVSNNRSTISQRSICISLDLVTMILQLTWTVFISDTVFWRVSYCYINYGVQFFTWLVWLDSFCEQYLVPVYILIFIHTCIVCVEFCDFNLTAIQNLCMMTQPKIHLLPNFDCPTTLIRFRLSLIASCCPVQL